MLVNELKLGSIRVNCIRANHNAINLPDAHLDVRFFRAINIQFSLLQKFATANFIFLDGDCVKSLIFRNIHTFIYGNDYFIIYLIIDLLFYKS